MNDEFKMPGDRDLRWRLECARQTYLEGDGQYEKALTNARRLLDWPGLGEKHQDRLLDREA